MKYAPLTDLTVPYADTTDADRAYRDREAMRALAELRLPDGSPMELEVGCDEWQHDCPCGYSAGSSNCPWGRTFDEVMEECCCPPGWVVWSASVGFEPPRETLFGPASLHPADAILLAARALEADDE